SVPLEPSVPLDELVRPENPCGTGVLVLSGSSGALESERAAVLAGTGAVALALRWFGGPGQQPGPFEVPLELFFAALDRLARECDRLAVLGSSFGAEAALLVATHDQRVDAVVGFAPSPVVWAGYDERSDPPRETSHWTLGGRPLPFVPVDPDWRPDREPPAYRSQYASSLGSARDDAWIPVERIRGEVVLAGGGDDQVWPGADFARLVAERRARQGLHTTVVTQPEAGHRVVLPGEQPFVRGQVMARGGSAEADASFGAAVWPAVLAALGADHRA
ncbi:MAG: acyl-CoA thioester hydrolase/BAAT C-terminal domain-containing protein, partial [Lapillicoccus sp.]